MLKTNYVFVCRSSLDLIRLVTDVEWRPSFTVWFLNFIQRNPGTATFCQRPRVDTAHKNSFTVIVKTCHFVVYCRSVMQTIRRWKKMKYCPFTKWLNFNKNICSHCERIFEFVLTLDGLILTWKYEEVDPNREREILLKWYKGS